MPPPAGGSSGRLPRRVEYLSPSGVLLPQVYGRSASLRCIVLQGPAAWQATPSWALCRLPCHRLLPRPPLMFAMVPQAAWPGSDPWPCSTALLLMGRRVSWVAPVPPTLGVWFVVPCPSSALGVLCCLCGVLGFLGPVHGCARSLCYGTCAVSLATGLLFTALHARCAVCAVSLATLLLFTGVPARCVVFGVQCPWPLGSCSRVCPLGVLCPVGGVVGDLAPVHQCARSVCCVCGVLGHLAPDHGNARLVCGVVYAVSLAIWLLFTAVHARRAVSAVSLATGLLFTGVPARCVALLVRCPHRCARSVCCVACSVTLATWLPFSGVPARCAVCAASLAT